MPALRSVHRSRGGRSAFTMVELIIVIVILGILAGIAVVTFGSITSRSQVESDRQSLLSIARDAAALAAFDSTPVSAAHVDAAIADCTACTAASASVQAAVPWVRDGGGDIDGDGNAETSSAYGVVAFGTAPDGASTMVMQSKEDGIWVWAHIDEQRHVTSGRSGAPVDAGDAAADPGSIGDDAADPPAAMGSVTAVPAPGQVTLSWDAVEGATSYRLEANGTPVGTTVDTVYVAGGLTSGTSYTFSVIPFNEGGDGPAGQVVTTPGVVSLTFANNGDTNGLFHHLGTKAGTQSWVNPAGTSAGFVDDWTTHIQGEFVSANLTDRSTSIWANNGAGSSSVTWDLGSDRRVDLDRYSMQMTGDAGSRTTGWELHGSSDGSAWTPLHSVSGHGGSINSWYDFPVTSAQAWRFVRLTTTSPNHVSLAEIELYGTLTTDGASRNLPYSSLGAGGLINHLGGSTFANPSTSGKIDTAASATLNGAFALYATDRDPNTLWHGDCSLAWINLRPGPEPDDARRPVRAVGSERLGDAPQLGPRRFRERFHLGDRRQPLRPGRPHRGDGPGRVLGERGTGQLPVSALADDRRQRRQQLHHDR